MVLFASAVFLDGSDKKMNAMRHENLSSQKRGLRLFSDKTQERLLECFSSVWRYASLG